jgi:DNA repair photolyase
MKTMTSNSSRNYLVPNCTKSYKAKPMKSNGGTQEWSVQTVNCCTGCSHDCRYCYAKEMAIRFKQVTAAQWALERVRQKDVTKRHKKYSGQVMFPSSHDITPTNLAACLTVMKNLLDVGNRVLVVSKPHLDCIREICERFKQFKDQILFRFTIGACDDQILSYWEPNAPRYNERKQCLIHAYQTGFQTSVSVEPMLDSANIDLLVGDLLPYVTHSLWIGTMNHLGRFGKGSDMVLRQAIAKIRRGQTVGRIKSIYEQHKGNPMIRWKKEIKKVVGIPVPRRNGLDI